MITAPTPEPSSSLSSVLDIIDKITKIAALFIAGAWGFLNYRRGRTFEKRLEMKISAKELPGTVGPLLSGTALIKNVGLSKFPIKQEGSGIFLIKLSASLSANRPVALPEEIIGVCEVFKDHAWIEPGETISEDFLVQLPADQKRVATKLDLRVVAAGIEWNASSIAKTGNAHQPTEEWEPATE